MLADGFYQGERGCVFHVAADYRLWARDPQEIYRSNVDGTRRLFEVAAQNGVERVVYTSTVATIAVPMSVLILRSSVFSCCRCFA